MFRKKPDLLVIYIVSIIFSGGCISRNLDDNMKASTFRRLDKIRTRKKEEVIRHFTGLQKIARGVVKDEKIINPFYKLKKQTGKEIINNRQPAADAEHELEHHYVEKYGNFYDMLFVDNKGYVFYSIKKESDYKTNLFSTHLSETPLVKHLKSKSGEFFIDYEYYFPSDEPAAFFVVTVKDENDPKGWIILQCSINKVNTILSDRKNLGKTGEVYLVNEKKLMLTDSRFMEDSTIMKLKIETEAVKTAMSRIRGNRIIKDYRDKWVFSSFEKFGCFGNSWILVVEIDEDEIMTDYYKKYKSRYFNRICEYIEILPRKEMSLDEASEKIKGRKKKKVDYNEFIKVKDRELLETRGVGPCTAVIMTYPGKFAYMAHVTPVDRAYVKGLAGLVLKDKKTDFIGSIVKRIVYYDIYPYQLRDLQFFIVATHNESFTYIVDELIDKGIEIRQIKFVFNPQANSANVIYDYLKGSLTVEWHEEKLTQPAIIEDASGTRDLEYVFKEIFSAG